MQEDLVGLEHIYICQGTFLVCKHLYFKSRNFKFHFLHPASGFYPCQTYCTGKRLPYLKQIQAS